MTSPTRIALVAVLLAGALAGGCGEDQAVASSGDVVEDIDEGEIVDDVADVDDPPDGEDADPGVEDTDEPDVETDIEAPDARDDDTIADVEDEELPDTGEDSAEDPDAFEVWDARIEDVQDEVCEYECFGYLFCADDAVWQAPEIVPCSTDPCGVSASTFRGACTSGCGEGPWCAEDVALLVPAEDADLFVGAEARPPRFVIHELPRRAATSERFVDNNPDAMLLAVDVAWDHGSATRPESSTLVREYALASADVWTSWIQIRGRRYHVLTGTIRFPDPEFRSGYGNFFHAGSESLTALSIVGQTADGTTVSAGWGWTADGEYTAWALVEPPP